VRVLHVLLDLIKTLDDLRLLVWIEAADRPTHLPQGGNRLLLGTPVVSCDSRAVRF